MAVDEHLAFWPVDLEAAGGDRGDVDPAAVLADITVQHHGIAVDEAEPLFRVARPGGLVAMANYSSIGFLGRISELIGSYGPPALVEVVSPFQWATPTRSATDSRAWRPRSR